MGVMHIYDGEVRSVAWMGMIFFAVFLNMAVFRNYVDTTFLKRYGAAAIPEMLLINGVLTIAVFGLFNRLNARFRDNQLLAAFFLFCGIIVGLLYMPAVRGMRIVYPILYQILNLQDSIYLVYLWNISCDLFDVRQGKRIFPILMACQVLGTTLGSFAAAPLATHIGFEPLLLICAAIGVALAAVIGISLSRLAGAATFRKVPSEEIKKSPSEIIAVIKAYPIVRYLIVIGFIPNILLSTFTYQFGVIAQHSFSTEHDLIAFLSIFRGTTTVVVFCLLFFMGSFYKRGGIIRTSLVQPINFVVLFGSLTAFFNIYIAAYGQFSTILIQRTIAGPINKLLSNVVPDAVNAWARVFARGTVIKAAVISGALILIILKPMMKAEELSLIAAVISLYWLWEALLFKKRFKEGLKQILADEGSVIDRIEPAKHMRQDPSIPAFPVEGWATLPMEQWETVSEEAFATAEEALKFLDDADPRTRARAAEYFSRSWDPRAVNPLIRCLSDSEMVRRPAIDALANGNNTVQPFLEEVLLNSASIRTEQGLLESIRLSSRRDFDVLSFVYKRMQETYHNIMALHTIGKIADGPGIAMLRIHLQEKNEDILNLVFHALWIHYDDMRLIYRSLRTTKASVAVEMLETTIDRELSRVLVPIIDAIPLERKISAGRKNLPLRVMETPYHVLAWLARSGDVLTRMTVAYVIGSDMPEMMYFPIVETLISDPDENVRQTAACALKRCMKGETKMPEIIFDMSVLKNEPLFAGLDTRSIQAIASIARQKFFKQGDVVIREGDETPILYIILDGEVDRIAKFGKPSEEKKGGLGKGSIIGELYFFGDKPARESFIVASAFAEMYAFHRTAFHEMMSLYPQIGINLCNRFASQLLG